MLFHIYFLLSVRSVYCQLQPAVVIHPSTHPLAFDTLLNDMHPNDKLFIEGENNSELRERKEAIARATYEFYRVKQAKLEKESEYGAKGGNSKEKKQLYRERANRASAAASRAKIVCYAKELEKRTDRLEQERNIQLRRAERAIQKLKTVKESTVKLRNILRHLWEKRDPNTCSYLVDSNALVLIASNVEDEGNEEIESQCGSNSNTENSENMHKENSRASSPNTNHESITPGVNTLNPTINSKYDKSIRGEESTCENVTKQFGSSALSSMCTNSGAAPNQTYQIPPIRNLENISRKRGYSVSQLLDPLPRPIQMPSSPYPSTDYNRQSSNVLNTNQQSRNLPQNVTDGIIFRARPS